MLLGGVDATRGGIAHGFELSCTLSGHVAPETVFRRYLCAVVGTGEKRRERGRHNLSGGSETVTIGGGRPCVFEGFPFVSTPFSLGGGGGCCLDL